jgi:BON domain
MEEGGIDASDVEVTVASGRVTLEGSVDNRMSKYQIEDMIETLGVGDVQNNLRVSRDHEWSGSGAGERSFGRGQASTTTTGASSGSSSKEQTKPRQQ